MCLATACRAGSILGMFTSECRWESSSGDRLRRRRLIPACAVDLGVRSLKPPLIMLQQHYRREVNQGNRLKCSRPISFIWPLTRVGSTSLAYSTLARVGNSRVVDEHSEAAKLRADALCGGGDRSLIGHVELARAPGQIFLATASPRSSWRDPTHTVKPWATRSSAICRPIPWLAPVTEATGWSFMVVFSLVRVWDQRRCIGLGRRK